MDLFIKIASGILISVILGVLVSGQRKEIALLLSALAAIMTLVGAFGFLQPILTFWYRLQAVAQLDTELFQILLKAVGIGLVAEFVAMVCTDAGNHVLSKALQTFAAIVILWLALPLFEQLMKLVEDVLGAI